MKIDLNICRKLYDEFNAGKHTYKKMLDYYNGKTDAFNNYKLTDRSNLKCKNNHIRFFVEEEVAYSVGTPVTYVDRGNNGDIINKIGNNISDDCLDVELDRKLKIFGKSYELHYIKDGEFKCKVIDPTSGIGYINTEGDVELFLYFYKKMLDDKTYIDIIDDNFIYHCDETFTQVEEATPHYFGKCPVGICCLDGDIHDTLYNILKEKQDIYETILSTWGNEIEDTRLAYLSITGADIDEETAKKMKKMGILQTKDANAKIGYVIKNIPSDFIKTYRDIIEDEMYKEALHVKNTVAVQSNTSGQMLATRLNCLRVKLTVQQKCLKKCIKTRLRDLCAYLNVLEGCNYNYKDIDINFTLNIPNNDIETAQIASQLNGKLSTRTILERLSFVPNGEEEFKRMLEEQKIIQESFNETVNLDEVGDEADEIN